MRITKILIMRSATPMQTESVTTERNAPHSKGVDAEIDKIACVYRKMRFKCRKRAVNDFVDPVASKDIEGPV